MNTPQQTAGGFTFGLKGLILLIALVGVVLALVNLWGVLIGISVATGASLLVTTIVLVTSIVLRVAQGPGVRTSRAMARLEKSAVWATVLTLVLTMSLVFAGGAQGLLGIYKRRALHHQWHEALGFRHEKISIVTKEGYVESYVEVTVVTPGGTLDDVGVREGEVIPLTESRFFRNLNERQGETWELPLGSGGSSGYWEDFATRSVEVPVPEL